jgi:hypothetical protein
MTLHLFYIQQKKNGCIRILMFSRTVTSFQMVNVRPRVTEKEGAADAKCKL